MVLHGTMVSFHNSNHITNQNLFFFLQILVACYHEKPFVCEDSDELLNYVAATNPGIRL